MRTRSSKPRRHDQPGSMKAVHEDISDLLADEAEDRFSSPTETRRKAMDLLARREYAGTELVKKLAGKCYDAGLAEEVVAGLAREGLQSDARFAESFVQSRIGQGKGPVRIRAELVERGLADGILDAALDAVGADWVALARSVREKKFGRSKPKDFAAKAPQMRFLQYRGFESEQIRAAVGEDAE